MTFRCCFALSALLIAFAIVEPARADHSVVLVYHHVSDKTPASTSVTPDRFEAHLDYLETHGFQVWPLQRLLSATLQEREDVPANVVAITFDDAYESVYTQAWPRLRERGWPFTVFVNTDSIDARHTPYMSWDQLRDLSANNITIGNHSASHGHLIARNDGESLEAWRSRTEADLLRANRRISEELNLEAELFAYPYGEDSRALAALVAEHFTFALVQRSGAVGRVTDPLSIPRFPMASGFDSLNRFALAVNARPLPVTNVLPTPPGDGIRGSVNALGLTLTEGNYRPAQLACFLSDGSALPVDMEAGPPRSVSITLSRPGSRGRNKINCTSPADDGSGDYYWFSYQWVQGSAVD